MIREISWKRRRNLAPLLSALLPGLGQALTRRWSSAVAFFLFFGVPAFFMKYLPRELNFGHHLMFGFLVVAWVLNVLDAWMGSPRPAAPCVEACPAHIQIPEYINLLLEGRWRDCHQLITRWTPLVGTIGHVCHHPCEGKCTRFAFDEPVAICPLKAYAGQKAIDSGALSRPPAREASSSSHKVAIVGSGPAGLTAAYFLALLGQKPTVFESLPKAGGMLAVGIPPYRLPRRVLEAEIAYIESHGVEIRTGVTVGRDVSVADLLADGYRAVLAAPGTHREVKLRVEGEDKEGVIPGLEFLRRVNLGRLAALEGEVVVVGGGNVAMDAARAALRLGAGRVTVVYRRSRLEMPANSWEVQEAEEEGVDFRFLSNPVRVLGAGRIEAVECVEMRLGEPDKSGRRRPIPVEGSEFRLPCRYLVPAIGLVPSADFVEGGGARLNPSGLILTLRGGARTHGRSLYAAGDAVLGATSVIQASQHGRQAAMAIYSRLPGRSVFRFPRLAVGRAHSDFATAPRVPQTSLPPGERKGDFRLIHQVYSEEKCLAEARRCLRCDLDM